MRLRAMIVALSAWGLCYAGYGANWYVATNGSDAAAGTNWATALLTVSQAVVRATTNGDRVLLSNGTHNIAAEIVITNGITLQGVYGRTNTILWRSGAAGYRLFTISNTNAVLVGLELRNGAVADVHGGAVWMSGGTIRDCNLVSNTVGGNAGGGAVYMTGGTVSNCSVTKNYGSLGGGGFYLAGSCLVSNCFITENNGYYYGGGIRMENAGAIVTHCVISNNTIVSAPGGGGIYMTAGTARNCLIARNQQTLDGSGAGGGGVYQAGGALLNCTVASNQVLAANQGGGVWWTGGNITNTVIYGNTRVGSADNLSASALTTIGYSCAPELTNGLNGNITADPDLIDMSAGNYRLAPGSPAIDSGTDMPDLTTDLDGAARPQDGDGNGTAQWDMGAYEAEPSTSGVLRCSFQGSPALGMDSLTVVYQAFVAGANTNGLWYRWDVNGDGTNDYTQTWPGLTNVYTPSIYNVALSVSNAVGVTTQRLKSAYITVQASALYVATNGAHTMPWTNWAMAATNLASALLLTGNGTTITVTNGTYDCSGLMLSYEMVLQSVNGKSATTLRNPPASVARLLTITHPQVVVTGFTLIGGTPAWSASGGAVYMSAGTVIGCSLVSNTTSGSGSGGAVYMTGGTVRDCSVTKSSASNGGGGFHLNGSCLVSNCFIAENEGYWDYGGIWMANAGALVTHCVINSNFTRRFGGGIYMTAGTARNCLIAENRVILDGAGYGGGGVRQGGGAVLNCTVASNQVLAGNTNGAGVWWTGGSITNTIVYGNMRGESADNLFASALTTIGYSCAPELTNGVSNISADPQFVYPATNNYRLTDSSPAINAGINQAWTIWDVDLDGAGRIRKVTVDMGAYEFQPPPGTVFTIH